MSLNELNETPLEEAQHKWGEVTERVRSSSAAWQAMLATAARNHKYSFRDQLMIHEYRPHATACAEHDFWEQRFHRRVHKGLKGIPSPKRRRQGCPQRLRRRRHVAVLWPRARPAALHLARHHS